MAHEPNPKEVIVEALFGALASDPPEDLDLYGSADAVGATIGGARFRIRVTGFVEEVDDGILSRNDASRALQERLGPALRAVADRMAARPVPGALRR